MTTISRPTRARRSCANKYVALIQKMFTLAGEPAEPAAADAKSVLSIETALATAMLDRVKRRDPASTQHHMTIIELQALSPNFNWRKYATASEAPPLPTINVAVPDYIRALNMLITAAGMPDLKAYLRWHVLHQAADLLPKAFADADFDFFSRTLAGQQEQPPRWRRCVTQTDERLGEALGKAFVEATFGPGQGRHAADGAGHQGRHGAGHRQRAVDERRDQEGRHGQAQCRRRSHRLSRQVARLLERPRDARRCAGEPAAGAAIRAQAQRWRRSASRSIAASGA